MNNLDTSFCRQRTSSLLSSWQQNFYVIVYMCVHLYQFLPNSTIKFKVFHIHGNTQHCQIFKTARLLSVKWSFYLDFHLIFTKIVAKFFMCLLAIQVLTTLNFLLAFSPNFLFVIVVIMLFFTTFFTLKISLVNVNKPNFQKTFCYNITGIQLPI